MVFPRVATPNRVQVEVRQAVGEDDNDNTVYETRVVVDRPARYYRDNGRELAAQRDNLLVEGVVAFHAESNDSQMTIPVDAEIVVSDGQFGPDGARFQVVRPTLVMTWHRPSHWEVLLGRVVARA